MLDTGARCGVIPILVIDPAVEWPVAAHADLVYRRGMHLAFDATAYKWVWVNNGVADIINIPSNETLPVDTAGLDACYAKARSGN